MRLLILAVFGSARLWAALSFDMVPAMDQAQVLSKLCPHCAFQMPEVAAYCPGCGVPMQAAIRATGTVGVLPETVGGALAYLSFIPAIIFLFVAPYSRNRFVRFHSLQCLMAWGAGLAVASALKLLGLILFFIPMLGPLFVLLIDTMAVLAAFLIWVVLVVKALQGEMFKLPVLGDFAERHSNQN
jgi:uncharacterized membrane protein